MITPMNCQQRKVDKSNFAFQFSFENLPGNAILSRWRLRRLKLHILKRWWTRFLFKKTVRI
jgi:hypothetical protein